MNLWFSGLCGTNSVNHWWLLLFCSQNAHASSVLDPWLQGSSPMKLQESTKRRLIQQRKGNTPSTEETSNLIIRFLNWYSLPNIIDGTSILPSKFRCYCQLLSRTLSSTSKSGDGYMSAWLLTRFCFGLFPMRLVPAWKTGWSVHTWVTGQVRRYLDCFWSLMENEAFFVYIYLLPKLCGCIREASMVR